MSGRVWFMERAIAPRPYCCEVVVVEIVVVEVLGSHIVDQRRHGPDLFVLLLSAPVTDDQDLLRDQVFQRYSFKSPLLSLLYSIHCFYLLAAL